MTHLMVKPEFTQCVGEMMTYLTVKRELTQCVA